MYNFIQFLISQWPMFWAALAGAFFVLGLLWARGVWGSYSRRIADGVEEQQFLLAARNDAHMEREMRIAARTNKQTDEARVECDA